MNEKMPCVSLWQGPRTSSAGRNSGLHQGCGAGAGGQIFGSSSGSNKRYWLWLKWVSLLQIESHCVICTTRLPHKLGLWNRNPNFRFRPQLQWSGIAWAPAPSPQPWFTEVKLLSVISFAGSVSCFKWARSLASVSASVSLTFFYAGWIVSGRSDLGCYFKSLGYTFTGVQNFRRIHFLLSRSSFFSNCASEAVVLKTRFWKRKEQLSFLFVLFLKFNVLKRKL